MRVLVRWVHSACPDCSDIQKGLKMTVGMRRYNEGCMRFRSYCKGSRHSSKAPTQLFFPFVPLFLLDARARER